MRGLSPPTLFAFSKKVLTKDFGYVMNIAMLYISEEDIVNILFPLIQAMLLKVKAPS